VDMSVYGYAVTPDFFALYGIPLLRGRLFGHGDDRGAVVVGERLARILWPGIDPIGRTFSFEGGGQFHVIGLAREIRFPSLDARLDLPQFYRAFDGVMTMGMMSIRCGPGCPSPALVQQRILAAHPGIRPGDASVRMLEDTYAEQLARPRAAAALGFAFAAVAVFAAAGGLFSVLSYAVSRRRREFGIRVALGASPGQIRRVVLRDGLLVATTGLAIGSLLAAALARGLASLQYGVTPYDPLSWAIVLGLIALTALGACWRPARAAARLDPQLLLREE
jgi:hypothetical protein